MNKAKIGLLAIACLLTANNVALAEGKLNIFSFAGYISPEVVEKFAKAEDVKVTIDTFENTDAMRAKLQAGASSYDIVVVPHDLIPIMKKEGLIQAIGLADLPNAKNLKPAYVKPVFDPDGNYAVPYQGGTTSFIVDRDVYDKPIDSWNVIFNPPKELQGKIGMFNDADIIMLTQAYLGMDQCSEDPAQWQKLEDSLLAQKPYVKVYGGGNAMREQMVAGELALTSNYSGQAVRGKRAKPSLEYIYPKEGVNGWTDMMSIPAGAPDKKNARLWLNFMMDPAVAAMNSDHAGYSNGIIGGEAGMKDELKNSPAINPPADVKVIFNERCTPKVNEFRAKVVSDLKQ